MSKYVNVFKDDFDTCYQHGILPILIGTAIGGVAAAIGSYAAAKYSSDRNSSDTAGTNAVNKEIAEKNLALQQERFDYDKALQQQIFEREDSAYQRTVNDMRAAGLSPLSMQNTDGAGEIISSTTPQDGFQAQAPAPMQAPDMSSLAGMFDGLAQAQDYKLRKSQIESGNAVSAAQANLMNAQAAKEWTSAGYQNAMLQAQLKKLGLENSGLSLSNTGKELENDYNRTRNKYSAGLFAQQLASGNLGLQGQAVDVMNALDKRDYQKTVGITDGMAPDERKAALIFYNLLGNTQQNYFQDSNVPQYDGQGNVYYNHSRNESNSESIAKGISNITQASVAADALKDVLGDFDLRKILSNKKYTNRK